MNGYKLLLLVFYLFCIFSTASPACIDTCKCQIEDSVVVVQCSEYAGSTMPSFDYLDLYDTQTLSLFLTQPDLTQVGPWDFSPPIKLSHATILGSETLTYDDSAFLNSNDSLKTLDLDVGGFAFDQEFAPVSPLAVLKKLTLRCGHENNDISITNELLSGPVADSLDTLFLESCGITAISAAALSNLEELQELGLPHNHLTEIADFLSTTKLTSLNLESNLISTVPRYRLPFTLEHLYLGHNNIKSIDGDTFEKLPNLINVDLSYNSDFMPTKESFLKLSRGFINLARTKVENVDFLEEKSLSTIGLDLTETNLDCDCKLFYYVVNKSADISGTCFDNELNILSVPGFAFVEYLQNYDCSCLKKPREVCELPPLAATSNSGHVDVCVNPLYLTLVLCITIVQLAMFQ